MTSLTIWDNEEESLVAQLLQFRIRFKSVLSSLALLGVINSNFYGMCQVLEGLSCSLYFTVYIVIIPSL